MTVTITNLTRKEWLQQIPEVISSLTSNYNFTYEQADGPYYQLLKKLTIEERMERDFKKYAHKIVLYKSGDRDNIFYLAVFSKKNPKVYVCDEYPNNGWSTWEAIKRFSKKFNLAYRGAVKYEQVQDSEEKTFN